jgi:ANTAR domain
MSTEPQADKSTLPLSLQALAQIAVQDAGADGYAIHQVDPRTGLRELKLAWGAPVPESDVAGFALDSFPLRVDDAVDGILTVVVRGESIAPATRAVLERIARAIEAVWRLTLVPGAYARMAARIGELEAELADAKIADRARGILANAQPPRDAVDAIVRHVESVLRPGQLGMVLTQLTAEMEQQIAERALANRAKAVLQNRYGMSEDQAHVHLRLVSRQSRRRLSDVARDFLEKPLR